MESVKDTRKPFRWVSTIAYKTIPKIVTRGFNTTELVEKGYNVMDLIYINYQSRVPRLRETKMLDYVMLVNMETGLDESAAMARYTIQGDPYITQACGASILAFGPAYGAFAGLGNALLEYMEKAEKENLSLAEAAKMYVENYPKIIENKDRTTLGVSSIDLKNPIPGRMVARAEKLGVAGATVEFMKEVVKAAKEASDTEIDLDLLGASTAVMMDLGFTPEAIWTIIAVGRAFAAGAHAVEEQEREGKSAWGARLTPKELYDGPAEREVPDIEDRDKVAQPNRKKMGDTLEGWYQNYLNKQKEVGSGWSIKEEVPVIKQIEEYRRSKQ